ncbi:MAG: M23 family metallopeptidase [Oscillospiraceae bacterium]|nr:M23 family metallopeptidase [Oscillospiraceae bacterium]
MNWKESILKFFREKAYYLALTVCLAAVAISGWLFVRSLSEDQEAESPDAVQAAVMPSLAPRQGQENARRDPVQPDVKKPGSTQAPESETPETAAPTEPVKQSWLRPLEGPVILGYSMDKLAYNPTTRDWRTHPGLDIGAAAGTEVKAAAEGTVRSVYADDLLGQTVTVEHAGGWVTHYANLAEELSVKAGDRVQAGQVLGTVGKTALGEVGEAAHLHFAVYKNNVPQDPAALLGQ